MRKLLAIIGTLILISPSFASAAIAFDAAKGVTAASASSNTTSFTAGTLTNGFIIWEGNDSCGGLPCILSSSNISGVTYNGASLTRLDAFCDVLAPGVSVFYGYAPASGANNVVVSYSASQTTRYTVATYQGVNQSNWLDASSTVYESASTAEITNTLTPVAANTWGIQVGSMGGPGTLTGNYTVRGNTSGSGSSGRFIQDTNATISGATTMLFDTTSANQGCGKMYSIAPAVAATPKNETFYLNQWI